MHMKIADRISFVTSVVGGMWALGLVRHSANVLLVRLVVTVVLARLTGCCVSGQSLATKRSGALAMIFKVAQIAVSAFV